jgi:hypothetical protein
MTLTEQALHGVRLALVGVRCELQRMGHVFLGFPCDEVDADANLPADPDHDVLNLLVPLLRAVEEARRDLEDYTSIADLGLARLRHVVATLGMVRAFDEWFHANMEEDDGKRHLAAAVTEALDMVDGLRGVLTPVAGSA